MAEQQNFRAAFNGFNREDVVQYIEQMNTKHAAEISQLNSDMQYLQDKLTQFETLAEDSIDEVDPALELKAAEQAARIAVLEQQLADAQTHTAENAPALTQKIDAQADRIAELEQELAEAREASQIAEALQQEATSEIDRLQGLLNAALCRQSSVQSQQDAELSAYRRAERVERQAKERAAQINNQVNGALADATAKVDDAAAQLAAMAEEAMQQIKQLQLAVTGSKLVLKDAATALYAIRPADEEE